MKDERLKEIRQNLKWADKSVPKKDVQDLLREINRLKKLLKK